MKISTNILPKCATDLCGFYKMALYVPLNLFVQILYTHTSHEMKISIKDFFSKCDEIRSFLRICSHLLKKYLMGIFIFCAVSLSPVVTYFTCSHVEKIFHTIHISYVTYTLMSLVLPQIYLCLHIPHSNAFRFLDMFHFVANSVCILFIFL